MNDQKIRTFVDRETNRGRTRIDGGCYARNPAAVLHLKSIHSAGVIRELGGFKNSIGVFD
jgi:hypothetical protein